MKKKLLIITASGIFVTLVTIAATFVALRGSSEAYVRTIPYNATAIARLDLRSFLSDADLSLQDVISLLRRSHESDDAKKVGVNMKRPVYAFISAAGNVGLAAAVSDEDDLEDFCESWHREGHASEIVEQRGYSWVVIEQQWLLAFDSKKALMMGPSIGAGQEQLRPEIISSGSRALTVSLI